MRILEEGHALRQEAYQGEREAFQALTEERERRHRAELVVLTRANEDLTRLLEDANALLGWPWGKP